MLKLKSGLCAAMLLVTVSLFASGQTAPAVSTRPTPPPAAKPHELKIAMMDGALVIGPLSVSELSIETKYGTLNVPVDQIQSFTPGLQSHPQFAKALQGYINDLGADAYADREKAQEALVKLGPDIKGELERQLKTAEAEKQNRLQRIVDDFEAQAGEEDAGKSRQWVNDDVIVTPGFTIVGRITTTSFSANSPYGKLDLKMEDIREARREGLEPEEVHKNVTVPGSLIAQRSWVPSGIHVSAGDQIMVTATGTIQLTPWGNQQSTPDGGGRIGMVQPGNIPGGALIARISDEGASIKVGSKATFTADRAGTLQFGIAVPAGGDFSSYQFPGEFQAKVRVIKK